MNRSEASATADASFFLHQSSRTIGLEYTFVMYEDSSFRKRAVVADFAAVSLGLFQCAR